MLLALFINKFVITAIPNDPVAAVTKIFSYLFFNS